MAGMTKSDQMRLCGIFSPVRTSALFGSVVMNIKLDCLKKERAPSCILGLVRFEIVAVCSQAQNYHRTVITVAFDCILTYSIILLRKPSLH